MDFGFTKEQALLQKMIAEFAKNEIAPLADELDKTSVFPNETFEKMAKLGLMGLNVPKEYGGVGLPDSCKVMVISELAKACASTAEAYAVHLLVNYIINKFGSEDQKKTFFKRACAGELGAFALTEPGAGSDAGSLQTTAIQDGDYYVINGSKCFISNLGEKEGGYAVVITLTDREKKNHGGMTAFLVDRNTPGFELGKLEDKMGIRAAAVSELVFTDCRVHKSCILGKVGDGFKVAMGGLDSGRIGIAAQSCGVAEAALNEAIAYAKTRIQFGKPIAEKQGIQFYLAEMATRVEAAYLLTYKAASMFDTNQPAGKNASMAKFYASETANWVAGKAFQIHGGYGYMKDYPIERIYRDARILTVYEGTSEVQKTVISRALLK